MINACGAAAAGKDHENCDGDEAFVDMAVNDMTTGSNYYDDLITHENDIVAFPMVSGYTGGYFVMISETTHSYGGNFGGLGGGHAKCLTELTSQNWTFKAEAQTRGLLVAAKVRIFNCDTATCQMPLPNTSYKFATTPNVITAAGKMHGGRTFTTNASGQGPGDTKRWDIDEAFGPDQGNWRSNIKAATPSLWATTPYTKTSAKTCNNWTSDSSAIKSVMADWDSSPNLQGRFQAGAAEKGV